MSSFIKDLYLSNKKTCKRRGNTIHHKVGLDVLDLVSYGYNQRMVMETLSEKKRYFTHFQRYLNSEEKSILCKYVKISFSIKSGWIDVKKPNHAYAEWSAINDLSNNTYSPFSLHNIAAAKAIKTLHCLDTCELLNIFNTVKSKVIFVRAGPNHERTLYNFSSIVRQFMFKKAFEPLAPKIFFEHVVMNPVPFCLDCGFFRKIEKSMCVCGLCNFLRYALVFTLKVEKPYHTQNEMFYNCIEMKKIQ